MMNGFEHLGSILQEQMGETVGANKNVVMELATITSNLGLKVARFDNEIPRGDYLIDTRLAIDYKPETNIVSSSADGHSHTVAIPLTEGIAKIKSGDMVLVCWVGDEPIVISVITNSNNI
jgi:hypothetical protein